ncbi:hypothetical protein K491DRAFT_689345 [Lophiostoma macrostomum CBS 122681]|uniref:ABM domain-containing protein n=1 Tax=Lophiostoma macrostomum CBS 122681 TaxID=1314788 RepID=A0A6A6TH32_9PLEO|nr:hypothetical protein K491DRAFT_689345 [Lophiostoma macrostomum CBS 122681]
MQASHHLQDLYTTHLNSPSMSNFLTLIPAASTTGLDLNHYRLVSGFLDLPGDAPPAGIMQDMRMTCTSPSARETLLSSLSSFVSALHSESLSARDESLKNGILTYMAFVSVDDDVGVRIFGRWRTREDMERFIRRDDAVGFWMGNKENVRAMEQRLYVENGKGWLHRGDDYAGKQGSSGKREGKL